MNGDDCVMVMIPAGYAFGPNNQDTKSLKGKMSVMAIVFEVESSETVHVHRRKKC